MGLMIPLMISAGCSTFLIGISVLQPAKMTIPSTIQRVSLFPGAGIPDPPGVIDSIHIKHLEPGYDYNHLKRGYMDGAYESMAASPRFLKVVIADTAYEDLLTSGKISWDEIKQICNHDTTDAVLMLKKAVSRDTLISYLFPGLSCSFVYRVINHTKWTFLEPFRQNTCTDIVLADTSIFDEENENCDPGSELENIHDFLWDAFYSTGTRFAELICPTWQNDIQRILYIGPGYQMRQASLFALDNQWDRAAETWNVLAESRNKRHASHASFNLALAWEQDDNLDQALLWINHADSLLSNGRSLAYKKILESRIKNRELLDQQMIR